MSRWQWIFLVVALAVGGGLSLATFGGTETPVDAARAEVGVISTFIEEQAKTRLPEVHQVTMPMAGRVLPIALTAGDRVRQGQIVAQLETADLMTAVAEGKARVAKLEKRIIENDDTRLETNALKQFDQFLESMNHTVRAAAAQTTASQAKVDFTQTEFERQKRLKGNEATTDRDYAEAELLLKQSQVDYAKDVLTLRSLESIRSAMTIGRESINKYIEKKSLQRAVLEQELIEAQLELEQLERDLERADVRSAVSGIVLARHVSNKRTLPTGELLLEIGQMRQLEIEAEILSEEAVIIQPGFAVDVAGPSIGPAPIAGTVERIEPQGFTKISSLGVEQQRVRVIIRFQEDALKTLEERGRILGADYRVRVRLYTGQHSNTVTIPRSALFRGGEGQWQVFAVRQGRAERIDVEVGLLNDFRAEILSGIQDGETVILAPEANLEPGQRVEPRFIPDLAADEKR